MTNGFPVIRFGQVQNGLWFTTEHLALMPQVPGQGSLHFWLRQDSLGEQSEFVLHSGRHVGGTPRKPWIQEQTACWFTSLHWLFDPHGDGWHGLVITGSKIINSFQICRRFIIIIILLGAETQRTKALPLIPTGHLQMGIWLTTSHIALSPHVPWHGFLHLFLKHAWVFWQSELRTHSGRHPV